MSERRMRRYGELQFDSYRELGRQLMAGIVGDDASGGFEPLFARWRSQAVVQILSR